MQLQGKVWKHKKDWIAEIPALDLMTQGKSRKNALKMAKDAICLLIHQKKFRLKVFPGKSGNFWITTDDIKWMLALILKRQRMKNNLSMSDVTRHLKVKSKNTYAQYEQAKSEPSLTVMQKLLHAINPKLDLIVQLGSF